MHVHGKYIGTIIQCTKAEAILHCLAEHKKPHPISIDAITAIWDGAVDLKKGKKKKK